MIGRLTRKVLKKPNLRLFSEAARKARMEVSVRSPYKTFLADCDAFSRIVTRTNEATLVIQNQTPPATYVLPPGRLQVCIFTQKLEKNKFGFFQKKNFFLRKISNMKSG